jgi:hypothetical protein
MTPELNATIINAIIFVEEQLDNGVQVNGFVKCKAFRKNLINFHEGKLILSKEEEIEFMLKMTSFVTRTTQNKIKRSSCLETKVYYKKMLVNALKVITNLSAE